MEGVEVVVVIATSMGRSDFLVDRSLYSVYQQRNINPRCIYIIDDNEDKRELSKLKVRIKALRESYFSGMFEGEIPQDYFHTRVIRNNRSRGRAGSGAWNCGAMHAYRTYGKGKKSYLAILDDDDAWHPDYLSHCTRLINQSERYIAAIISSFYRCEPDGDSLVTVQRNQLSVNDFLVGNPGWQGSNTFVEMTAFWKAGGYDESMYSTHDRDFAIRFLDVCEQNGYLIDTVSTPLMRHYVHEGERVTTCPARKKQGLDAFYRKYKSRMTESMLSTSLARAAQLFGYTYATVSEPLATNIDEEELKCAFHDAKPVHIVIGVVSSDANNVQLQLASILRQLQLEPQFFGFCHYVVMTNGEDEKKIKDVMVNTENGALTLRCVDFSEQQTLDDSFPFADEFVNESLDRKSIAYSRSLLQFYCATFAQGYGESCVVLILDDDLIFESLRLDDNQVKSINLNFFGKVSHLRHESKAGILVSAYSDSPPLPFYSSIRTQLVDVLHTLRLLLFSELVSLDQPAIISMPSNYQKPDYYYDLSSTCYDHLELPLSWLGVDRVKDLKGNELLKTFLVDFQYLMQEANITRPLLMNEQAWLSLKGEANGLRGGIAIYLNLNLLHEIPHLSPLLSWDGEARRSRRSDFISSIAMEKIYGVAIETISYPLRHDRRKQNPPCHISCNKLLDDIIGMCFYRTFQYRLSDQQPGDKKVKAHFAHNIRECLGKLKVNNLRIRQLLVQIEALLMQDANLLDRVRSDSFLAERVDNAIKTIRHIEQEFVKRKFNQQLRAVKKSARSFDVIEQMNAINFGYGVKRKKHHQEEC